MQILSNLIDQHGIPRQISWGTHEGIRGAHWIDVQDDGMVHRRYYLPNTSATMESKEVGVVSKENYQELLTFLCSIPFEEINATEQTSVSPPTTCHTLECNWSNARWEHIFSTQQDHQKMVNQLVEMFLDLAKQAIISSGNNPE